MISADENDALVKATADVTQALRRMAEAFYTGAEQVSAFQFIVDEQPVVRLSHNQIRKMNPADRARYLTERRQLSSKHRKAKS